MAEAAARADRSEAALTELGKAWRKLGATQKGSYEEKAKAEKEAVLKEAQKSAQMTSPGGSKCANAWIRIQSRGGISRAAVRFSSEPEGVVYTRARTAA